MSFSSKKIEGLGLGLRFPHFDNILEMDHSVNWFEVITDDFLTDGPHHQKLSRLRQDLPIAFHSIGLNIGGIDEFNKDYLKKFKKLFEKFKPDIISDHLCWSAHNGKYHHDLLPIPRTKEGLINVCNRVDYLQSFFNRKLSLENITAYVDYKECDYSEIDFIKEIVSKTDCELILDITNVSINHFNRNKSSLEYFEKFPMDAVNQIHIAGGEKSGEVIIDTHGAQVESRDIAILQKIKGRGYNIPVLLERDRKIPSFLVLEQELKELERVINE